MTFIRNLIVFAVIVMAASFYQISTADAQQSTLVDISEIGPGDTIEVRIPAEPDLSGSYTIDEKGKFEFPLILGLDLGSIEVTGKNVQQTEEIIRERLSRYYTMTEVSVELISLGVRPNRSISIFGHIASPGNYQFYENMKLLDVLSRAGRLTDEADPGRLTVHREGSDPMVIDISGILSGRDLTSNVKLQAGDYIIVPPVRPTNRIKVVVLGSVGTPGTYFIRDGALVLDALAEAEGTINRAAVSHTHIIRAENGKPVVIPIDVKALLDKGDIRQNVELMDGDIVFVPETSRVDIMRTVNDIISLNLLKNIVKDEF